MNGALLEQLVVRHRRDPSVIGAPPPSLMTMLLTAFTYDHNVDRAHRLILDAKARLWCGERDPLQQLRGGAGTLGTFHGRQGHDRIHGHLAVVAQAVSRDLRIRD
jgi:hypothetical protein